MYKSVLIPVALDHEQDLSAKIGLAKTLMPEGGAITALTVLEQLPSYVAEYVGEKSEGHLSQIVLEKLKDAVKAHPDVECEVITGKAGVAISEYAARHEIDLIVIGSHRPGLQDYFLGSTTARVVRRAPCAVLVQRENARYAT